MTKKEFEALIKSIEKVETPSQLASKINHVANCESLLTKKQWTTALTALVKVQSDKTIYLLKKTNINPRAILQEIARNEKGGKQMSNVEETKTEVVETKPEVLTGEVVPAIDAKTVKTVEAAIDRVSKKLITISNGYLSIVGDVAHLYDLKAWEVTKHNNIYEMCEAKFDGMARGTVNNLLSIFKRFGDKETYKLTAEASNEDGAPRSVRSLLEQIKTEKKALKAEKNGGAIGDGEGNGDGNGDGEDTKKKVETLANISFDIIGGEWDAEAIAEELKKAIEKAQADLSQDCTITLTITR